MVNSFRRRTKETRKKTSRMLPKRPGSVNGKERHRRVGRNRLPGMRQGC